MAKYQQYEEYKDSGVEWLGEIPKGWNTIQVGRLYIRNKRTGFVEKELLSVYRDYGVIPKSSRDDNNNKPSDDLSPYQLVKPDDLVMNKMKAWQGSIAISEYEGIVSPAYFVYEPNPKLFDLAFPRYVHYLLRSPIYITQYMSRSKGIRVNQWDLDPDEFKKIELLLPSKDEQSKIFEFLDHETAQIDTLIEKQQTLIQLLKEKRQAVISHAVTKGLNPDAPMKDSGVEWLGDVPEHWEVIKFGMTNKNAVLGGNYASSEGYDGIPVIKMGNLGRGIINISKVENLYKNDFHEIEHILKKGDFLFNTRNSLALVGKVSIWREELGIAIYNSNILRVSFNRYIGTSEYVGYLFNSDLGLSQLRLIAKGTTNVAAIYYKDLRSLVFAYPPTDEQYKIVEFLDNKCASLDLLIEKAEQAIQLMQERRTALISAAVTGKIDVRGWVAPDVIDNVEVEIESIT